MDSTDTYVICYTGPGDLWIAFSIRARQAAVGANPKKALANAITAVDQTAKSGPNHSSPCASNSAYELMLKLAETAQPLPDGDCTPGVLYKYERA